MDSEKPLRPSRGEGLAKTTLALALAAAVVWALVGSGGAFHVLGLAG